MERLSEIIEFINNKEILNILLGAFITILTGTVMFVIQSTMKYLLKEEEICISTLNMFLV